MKQIWKRKLRNRVRKPDRQPVGFAGDVDQQPVASLLERLDQIVGVRAERDLAEEAPTDLKSNNISFLKDRQRLGLAHNL